MRQKRESLHKLLDLVLDVQDFTEHYIDIELSNYGSEANLYVIKNGWQKEADFDCRMNFDKSGQVATNEAISYCEKLLSRK